MNVYLTFDVEIWCNGWNHLDLDFPTSFDRYVYGRSSKGQFALPKTLEILDQYGLKGVFFVEPLFAGRFGVEHLATIVALIQSGCHDIQLHLHPEWSDEIRPSPFFGATGKRQHLSYYSLDEQCTLIELGRNLLAQAGQFELSAFRAGSFACNANTYQALRQSGIRVDSSLNAVLMDSGRDLRDKLDFLHPSNFNGVQILPLTVFIDGFGRLRPAQVGACSFLELRDALYSAYSCGIQHFVLLSHNFEMLKQSSTTPDQIVLRRFTEICSFLQANRDIFNVCCFPSEATTQLEAASSIPSSRIPGTLLRHGEQLLRRLIG